MFILFHRRVCGPLANSLFHHRPNESLKPGGKIEAAYHKVDHAIQHVLDLRDEFSDWPLLETNRSFPCPTPKTAPRH
jgi:hypothetical protein